MIKICPAKFLYLPVNNYIKYLLFSCVLYIQKLTTRKEGNHLLSQCMPSCYFACPWMVNCSKIKIRKIFYLLGLLVEMFDRGDD